jgi:hypothetical protein
MPSDRRYKSAFEFVTKPKTVINAPRIENIKPMGILISTILISSYQNNILNTKQIIPTRMARPIGRLYQEDSTSIVRGVRE